MYFIYLFCLLFWPTRPLPRSKRPIYWINPEDERDFVDLPIGRVKIRRNLDEISFWDLLTRRVLFLGLLRSSMARNFYELLLVRISRFLFLDVSSCNMLAGLQQECLFDSQKGARIMYSYHKVAADILSFHWPDFQQVVVTYEVRRRVQKIFYLLVKLNSFRLKPNLEKGISLFINIYSENFIKSYLLMNPNRQIIIRYFDDLELHFNKDLEYFKTFLRTLQNQYSNIHVESYSRKDAQQLGCAYVPNAVNPERLKDSSKRRYLISFFGDSSKNSNRNVKLQELVLNLKKNNELATAL